MDSDEDSRSSSNSSESESSRSTPQHNTANSVSDTERRTPVSPHSPVSANDNEEDDDGDVEHLNDGQKMNDENILSSEDNKSNRKADEDDDDFELSDLEDDEGAQGDKTDDRNSDNGKNSNMNHDDLSDVSDLESPQSESQISQDPVTDLRQKLEERKQKKDMDDSLEKKDDEDVLDFEIEEDECREVVDTTKKVEQECVTENEVKIDNEADGKKSPENELESGEELEDGEVTDDDEKRPEESEPKPICRFYNRGQCTWGISCRFLHPGVTDKGNYTMFEMVRPIPLAHQPQPPSSMAPPFPGNYPDFRNERPQMHHMQPHHIAPPYAAPHVRPPVAESESAWERGLRTAKEMMRKANKRKEQDVDFDEKKMNLSGAPDESEKDNYYMRDRASPPEYSSPSYERNRPVGVPPRYDYSPPVKYARGSAHSIEEDTYGRQPRYREHPAHRMPVYEEEDSKRRIPRPPNAQREVIVEKADEWNDPWMRSKSPGRRGGSRDKRGRRERSYSSNSSYSSSSTSRSGSSSETSRSPSPATRRRYDSHRSKEKDRITAQMTRKGIRGRSRSMSAKRRFSPVRAPHKRQLDKKHSSSPINERHVAVERGIVSTKRKRLSPSLAVPHSRVKGSHHAHRKKHGTSSSGSGSSSGTEESDSSYSSSTSSSKGKKAPVKREKLAVERKASKKVEMSKKVNIIEEKAKSSEKTSSAATKKSTRREELLKQLRAVEDAIARKGLKMN